MSFVVFRLMLVVLVVARWLRFVGCLLCVCAFVVCVSLLVVCKLSCCLSSLFVVVCCCSVFAFVVCCLLFVGRGVSLVVLHVLFALYW